MEEWREAFEREREARGLAGPVDGPVELDDTPELHVLQRRGVALAEPYIREVRVKLFGSPEPRWATGQYQDAVAWLTDTAAASLEGLRRDEGARQKYRELLERLMELTGALWHSTTPMIPYVAEGGRVVAHVPYALGSELSVLERAANEVAGATGFAPARVVEWVLTGTVPRLVRASLNIADKHGSLADKPYRRRTVTLTLRSSLREADFRRLFRHVRRAWAVGEAFDFSPSEGREGAVLTQLDRHLQSVVETMPLADYTWAERLGEWRRQAPEGWVGEEWATAERALVPADTLRRRWARMQAKLQEKGHVAEEDTNG